MRDSLSKPHCSFFDLAAVASVTSSLALFITASFWENREGVVSRSRALRVSDTPTSLAYRVNRDVIRAEVNYKTDVHITFDTW